MIAQKDYFSILGLKPSFDIDLPDLEKRYFTAQRAFHPDRLVGKGVQERRLAIEHSMLLNSAYEALKSPLKRAQYILSLKSISTDTAKPSEALLMEIMELRENLMETNTMEELVRLEEQNADNGNDVIQQISKAFGSNDTTQAAELVIRLSYIHKIADEIRIRKKLAV